MKYASLCLVLLLFTMGQCANVTYTFGVNLGLNAADNALQVQSLRGYEIWVSWWNARPPAMRTTPWGDTFTVALHVNTFSNYGYEEASYQGIYDSYRNMSTNSSIDFFFATTAWEGVRVRRYASQSLGIDLMIGPTDSSEAYYRIPGSFGTPTANQLTMASWLAHLRIGKAKTLSVMQVNDFTDEPEGVYQYEMCSGIVAQAALNGLTVVNYFEDMPFDWWTQGRIEGVEGRAAVWRSALDTVIASNPDAVIICDYSYGAEFSLNYMREKNWTPKMIGISPVNIKFQDPSLLDYVIVPSSYSPFARYPAQAGFTDSAGYDSLARAKYGVGATSVMAASTLAGMLFSHAIVNSPSNGTSDIADTLRRGQLQSFLGTSVFDVNNRQTMLPLMIQLGNSGKATYIAGPPLAAEDSFIYPIPTWAERTFRTHWGSAVEIVGAVLMAVGIACNIVWVVLFILNWNNQVLRASSPVFCLTLIGGGTLVYISLFTWMPNLVSGTMCSLRALILPLGFMALFGSLIAKSDRIYRIFTLNTIDVIRISDLQVAFVILLILVGQVILSILSTTVTRLTSTLRVVDEHRPSLNYYTCTSSSSLQIIFGINVAYVVALLGWGTYLAYHIRLIPYSLYDESKTIIFSIYNAAVFCAVAIVIQQAVGNSHRDLTFMVTAVCSFLGVMITTCTLFIPKFKSIYLPGSESTSSGSTHSSRSYGDLDSLRKENEHLKAELSKLGHTSSSPRSTSRRSRRDV